MFTVEARTLWVVLREESVGVAGFVMNAKQPPHILLVLVSNVLKLLTLYLIVMQNDVTRDAESLLAVLPSVEEFMFASLQHVAHC